MAMVASTANPREPPIWRAVLSTPEASPASLKCTPTVAAEASGVNSSPMASEMMQPGAEDVGPVVAVRTRSGRARRSPRRMSAVPTRRRGRTPTLGRRRELIWAPMMMAMAIGRKARPGLERAVAQDVLQVEGEEVPHGEEAAPTRNITTLDPGNRARAEEAERHERGVGHLELDEGEDGQQDRGDSQDRQGVGRAPRMRVGADDGEDQGPQPGGDGDRSADVEPGRVLVTRLAAWPRSGRSERPRWRRRRWGC